MSRAGFERNAAGALCAGSVSLSEIAETMGTPCYVYSEPAIKQICECWAEAFADCGAQLCYSVKANSALAVLRLFSEWGWNFDIVSGGELARLSHLDVDMAKVRFSGVGKTAEELERAVQAGVGAVHLESAREAELLEEVAAEYGRSIDVAVRVNPDVEAGGQTQISTGKAGDKFGVPLGECLALYRRLAKYEHLRPSGVAFHIGSQIDSPTPYLEAMTCVLKLVDQLRADGIAIEDLDVGGGAAVSLSPQCLAQALVPPLQQRSLRLVLSPGRALVADAGVLLMQVLYRKEMGGRQLVIVDAAMNDYIRPMLYDLKPEVETMHPPDGEGFFDLHGSVCESTDVFLRSVPGNPAEGDVLVMRGVGAYGMSMSSNYNSRPRPPEVLVSQDDWRIIRRRENMDDLLSPEMDDV